MEMTGLDIQKDSILELACVLTDGSLKNIVKGPNLIIHCDKEILDKMDLWCITTHTKSGLVKACIESKLSI